LQTGPVPTFCSQQPEVSAKQLTDNPEYAFECLQALVTRLLARRELSREEAEEYCRDPREGDFRKILRRTWIPQDHEKTPSGKGNELIHIPLKWS